MFKEIKEYIELSNSRTLEKWCSNNLSISNPEYYKKLQMGFWLGNTPQRINFYEIVGDKIRVPYGCLYKLEQFLLRAIDHTKPKYEIEIKEDINLYDYQKKVVDSINKRCGIIKAPAGSGKTQIGIALIKKLGYRALWLTHTKDLLNQSRRRYEFYFGKDGVGTITEGKVNIGKKVTFATVQTMSKLDLNKYKDEFDVVIVDECHNVVGSPTKIQMFYKVLNNLNARYKYGLTATLHRSDGLVEATKSILGDVIVNISEEEVKGKILDVGIKRVDTGIKEDDIYLNFDGTINWTKLIAYICNSEKRNKKIVDTLIINSDKSSLILSDRISHLKDLRMLLPKDLKEKSVLINGKTNKGIREKAIADMQNGTKKYMFATYSLAKEGLDIPRLERLYMTTPKSDYAVVIQSIGRIARTFEDKKNPIAYDFVDDIGLLQKKYKDRWRHYRKINCYEVLNE